MASFRALVLAFVTRYLTEWGQSPSYGEIAAGLSSNRFRVKRAVVSLERSGLLIRGPAPRGLMLPDAIAEAQRTLARAGLAPPAAGERTNQTLLPPAVLTYPARNSRTGDPRDDGTAHDQP
jgi:hypothetical protein